MDTTEHPPGNQTRNEPVPFLDCPKNSSNNTQNTEQHVVTTPSGDTTTSPLTTATPLIEEGLVRDEKTNEIYIPLSSTVVLKRKQEMLYVPLDFENYLTVDALVDTFPPLWGLIHFPHLTMQVKTASSETTTKPQPVIIDEALTIPPTTTKTITAFIDCPSKWNTTGTVTPLEKFTEAGSLLISHSMSTIIYKRVAVRVTNTTE